MDLSLRSQEQMGHFTVCTPATPLPVHARATALREQTAKAVTNLRHLKNARLDALALWDAAIDGDVRAVVAVVKIVQARVHLNGLDVGKGDTRQPSTPRTLVVSPTA
jgi:hypothetical protein